MSPETPTILDVAKLAKVSKSTVSRVLNNSSLVKIETRKAVEEAMQKLKFTPNIIARGMRKGVSNTIGVIIPEYANIFYSMMFKEIEKELNRFGYMAIICPAAADNHKEIEYCEQLLSRNIDGIIFFDYNISEQSLAYLLDLSKRLPLVLMDESKNDPEISRVYTDSYHALYTSTNFLISHGHQRIAILLSDVEAVHKRFCGYCDALKEADIPLREEYILPIEFNIPSGVKAAKRYLALDHPPTGIVSEADYPAIGMLNALMFEGKTPPHDFEMIAYDNIDISSSLKPHLSTIAQPAPELARAAVNILMDKIYDPSKIPEVIKAVFMGKLILRDTTKLE